jgi:hypothetical protein
LLRGPNSEEYEIDLKKIELRLRRLDRDDAFSPSERELEYQYFTHWRERLGYLLAKEHRSVGETIQDARSAAGDSTNHIKVSDESWKAITPHVLFRAVINIREDFERVCDAQRDFFQTKCFKELHELAFGLTEPIVFKNHFDACIQRLQQVVVQSFSRFLEIALKQAGTIRAAPVHWSSLQTTDLIEREDRLVENWIKSVCDKRNDQHTNIDEEFIAKIVFRTDWRAPRWLIMQPNGNARYDSSASWDRMNEVDTKRILRYMRENRWILLLEATLKDVVGSAYEILAKRADSSQSERSENARKPVNATTLTNTPKPLLLKYRSGIKRAILRALTDNPVATDAQVCRSLDADGGEELPAGWRRRKDDRSFFDAYANPETKRKVEIAISKIRRDLRDRKLLG